MMYEVLLKIRLDRLTAGWEGQRGHLESLVNRSQGLSSIDPGRINAADGEVGTDACPLWDIDLPTQGDSSNAR